MATNDGKALTLATKPRPSEMVQADDRLSASVVESVVTKGDISALTPQQKSDYYVQRCRQLGLDPASKPFAILRLQGKEVLYAEKGAADQLAKIHRVNRKITDGPKVIDVGGTKLVYAQCEASLPDGRSEMEVATVPLSDPANVLMKCVSKVKRRATLAILGLGMLDEMETETIPASVKAPGPRVEIRGDEVVIDDNAAPEEVRDVPQTILDAMTSAMDANGKVTVAQAGAIWNDHRADITADNAEEVQRVLLSACPPGTAKAALINAIESAKASGGVPPALVKFHADLEHIDIPGESVGVWVKHRAAISVLPAPSREAAWRALCKKTEEVGKMKNAKVWLKRAIAEEDARAAGPHNGDGPPFDDGPRGGGAPRPAPANDAPDAAGEGRSSESGAGAQASARAEAWRREDSPRGRLQRYLDGCANEFRVKNGLPRHWGEFVGVETHEFETAVSERLVEVTAGTRFELTGTGALRTAQKLAMDCVREAAA
jgi:hypothetical protein